jgi:hypothetical protein
METIPRDGRNPGTVAFTKICLAEIVNAAAFLWLSSRIFQIGKPGGFCHVSGKEQKQVEFIRFMV